MADPIQTKTNSVAGAPSGTHTLSASFTSLPAVGNTVLVLAWGWDNGLTVNPSVSDNQSGNSYTRRRFRQNATSKQWVAIFDLLSVVGSSGTFTVTVDDGAAGASFWCYLAILEVANKSVDAGLDASGTNNSPAPGSVGPATASDFAVALFESDSGTNDTVTSPASPWVSLLKKPNGAGDVQGEIMYANLTSSSAVNPTWTLPASHNWDAAQELYQGAGGGAAPAAHLLTALGVGG